VEGAGPVLHPSQKTARDCAVPHLPVGSVHLPVTMLYLAPLLWPSAWPGQFLLFTRFRLVPFAAWKVGASGEGVLRRGPHGGADCWCGLLAASLRWLCRGQTPRLARIQGGKCSNVPGPK